MDQDLCSSSPVFTCLGTSIQCTYYNKYFFRFWVQSEIESEAREDHFYGGPTAGATGQLSVRQ